MTEQQDPRLQALFANAWQDLDGEAFTSGMMAKTRLQRYRTPALIAVVTILVVVCAILLAPSLLTFALLTAQALTTNLVELGDGWLGLALSPINNIASLLILGAKIAFMGWKVISRTSYTD